jgi:hypothetical protein
MRRYPDLPGYGLDTTPEDSEERKEREAQRRQRAEERADYDWARRKDKEAKP